MRVSWVVIYSAALDDASASLSEAKPGLVVSDENWISSIHLDTLIPRNMDVFKNITPRLLRNNLPPAKF